MTDPTPLTAWLPLIVADVPGAPEPLLLRQLRAALDGFCRATGWWRRAVGPAAVSAGQAEWVVAPPPGLEARVHRLLLVRYHGRILQPAQGPLVLGAAGPPLRMVEHAAGRITLWPVPAVDALDALDGIAILAPSPTATVTEPRLFERWAEGIAAGALARLFGQNRRPWSDPRAAEAARERFHATLDDARIDALRQPLAVAG